MIRSIAFVFAARADAAAATWCKESLAAQGVAARIVADGMEAVWTAHDPDLVSRFPRHGRLRGTECAAGMLKTMRLAATDAHVALKVDADTRLSAATGAWLASCPTGTARGIPIGRYGWSGIWAVPVEHLASAAAIIGKANCADCPEARLVFCAFRAMRLTLETTPVPMAVWAPGRPFPREAPAVTLPTSLRGNRRTDAALKLHYAPDF